MDQEVKLRLGDENAWAALAGDVDEVVDARLQLDL